MRCCTLLSVFALLFTSQSICHAADKATYDAAGFQKSVAPFLKAYCVTCHGGKKPDANLSLANIDPDMVGGRDFEIWRMIAERLKFDEMPPKDQLQPKNDELAAAKKWIHTEMLKTQQPDSPSIAKLLLPEYGNYVDHNELFHNKPGPVIPAKARLWRIRPAIYDRIVSSVARGNPNGLSDPLNLRSGDGIKDFSAPYFIDEPTANMLLSNAEKIVNHQLDSRNHFRDLREFVGEGNPPTEKQVIRAIETEFRSAMNRGPTSDEIKRFIAFREKVAKISGQVIASKTMMMAILMRPEVVFRFELGEGPVDNLGRRRLSQREIAFAISFALGNQVDRDLLNLAMKNKLGEAKQIAAAVDKRLQDFNANPRLMQFFREYFGYPKVLDVFKDQPEKGRHDPKLLLSDIETLVSSIVRRDKQVLRELLTTNKVFVIVKEDPKTGKFKKNWGNRYPLFYATTYGLPADWRWTEDQPLSLPADERAGVLTHPAWLAAWGGNFDNHPVQRGKWVRTHLLGGTVPELPIGVDARIPEDEHKQLGERLAMVTTKMECWRCHRKMNPLGMPFEQFDHYGRYRRFEVKRPVKVDGAVTYTGVKELEGKFDNVVELMQRLAKSQHVEQVFVRHVFRFIMGRNETLGDAATLQNAHKAYRDNDGSFRALVASLLTSESFLYRRVGKK